MKPRAVGQMMNVSCFFFIKFLLFFQTAVIYQLISSFENTYTHSIFVRKARGYLVLFQSFCKIKGARLWNYKFNLVNYHLYENAWERLSRNTLLKHINHFVKSHFVCVLWYCHDIILICSMFYHKTISKYRTHWYWTTHFENIMFLTHLETIKFPP